MRVGGQRNAPAALPPGKTRYPLYRRLGVTVLLLLQSSPMGKVDVPGLKVLADLLTYLPTPYSTVLLQKLTGSQLVKKSPAFYGT